MVKLVDEMFARYVRTQDAEALAVVFERTAPALARRARRLIGDARAAEDLVQDLFLSLLAGAVAWDPSRPCRPWLVGALHRRAARWHRNGGRWPLDPLPNGLHGKERSPEQSASDRELLAAVHAAMVLLPAASRDVVHRYVELHETPQEIGRALGRAPGTVRVQLHRGLHALRDRLPAGFLALALAMIVRPAPAAPVPVLRVVPGGARVWLAITAAMLVLVAAVRVTASPPTAPGASSVARAGEFSGEGGGTDAPAAPALRVAGAAAAAAVSGRFVLRHADGSPAAGVGVLFGPAGHDPDFGWQQAVSDAQGAIAIARVAAGEIEVTTDRGTQTTFVLHGGANEDGVVDLPAGIDVTGRVVDAQGAPVANAGIWVAHEPRHPWDGLLVAFTGGDGQFSLRGMAPTGRLAAAAPGRAPSPLHTVGRGPRRNVVLCVGEAGATVSGRVRALDGAPVAGAVVRIGRHNRARFVVGGGDQLGEMMPSSSVHTGVDGRFRCDGLPPGRLEVCVRARGFAAAVQPLHVDGGERRDVELRLRPGCVLHGVVRDADGAPVAGASVSTYGRASHEWSGVFTASDGSFDVGGVAAERIVLAVVADGFVSRDVPVHASACDAIDVSLERAPVVCAHLVDEAGRAVDPGEWEIACRMPQCEAPLAPVPLAAAADGTYELSADPDVRCLCRRVGKKVWLPCRSRRDAPARVELVVAGELRDCTLTIRFGGFTPAQLADARVWLVRDGEPYVLNERAAGGGDVASACLPAGDYEVHVFGAAGVCPRYFCGVVALRGDTVHELTAQPSGTLRYAPPAGVGVERWHAFVLDQHGIQSPLQRQAGAVALAAGRYTLWAGGLSFMTVRGLPFEVRAGEETLLEVPLRAGIVRHVAFQLPAGADARATVATLRTGGELVLGGEPGLGDGNFDAQVDGFCCATIVLADGAYDLELCCGAQRWAGTFTVGGEEGAIEPVIVPLRPEPGSGSRSK